VKVQSHDPSRATAVIRSVKVTEYDAELHCDVRRGVGFAVACQCGWRSTTHPTLTSAKAALRNHRAGGHVKREAVSATSETGA
jgi:hypothetical protein